jgi:hypothetical protein
MGAAGLVLFVVFVLLFWPLGVIVRSRKVEGERKIHWVAGWFAAFLSGMVAMGGLMMPPLMNASAPTSGLGVGQNMVLAVLALLGPVWLVRAAFYLRTRRLRDIPAPSMQGQRGYRIGRVLGSLLRKRS